MKKISLIIITVLLGISGLKLANASNENAAASKSRADKIEAAKLELSKLNEQIEKTKPFIESRKKAFSKVLAKEKEMSEIKKTLENILKGIFEIQNEFKGIPDYRDTWNKIKNLIEHINIIITDLSKLNTEANTITQNLIKDIDDKIARKKRLDDAFLKLNKK